MSNGPVAGCKGGQPPQGYREKAKHFYPPEPWLLPSSFAKKKLAVTPTPPEALKLRKDLVD